ncbi:MAG TPA: SPOR domain-containing protein [Polyangia bacterium]|jgi:hypothetical protein
MDEPALRDVERWKDKIEVRLDNRQVFFLFFGSAMVACMLFVLGVIVGKRLESRGRAEAPVIEDPLAALDRFGTPASSSPAAAALTFPHALIGNPPPGKAERLERGANRSTLTTALSSPAPTVVAPTPVNKKTALLPRPLPVAVPTPAKTATATLAAKTTPPQAVSAPAKATVALASKPAAKPPVVASHADKDKQKANFLLQLSSFQDRAEADAFARRFSAQNAYVVASEVPGKGLWYRVRVGSYGNLKDATVAKSAFEREHGVIAYVAGNGPAQ